jgi:hypothetical protein
MISQPKEFLSIPLINPFLQPLSPSIPIPVGQGRSEKRIYLGELVNRKYALESILGIGATGQVVSGFRLSDSKPVAIKTIRKVTDFN